MSFMGWSMVVAIRGLDELQRRIVLEAIFGAFVTGALLTLLYGQLQHARVGLPELNWAFVWAAMAVPVPSLSSWRLGGTNEEQALHPPRRAWLVTGGVGGPARRIAPNRERD